MSADEDLYDQPETRKRKKKARRTPPNWLNKQHKNDERSSLRQDRIAFENAMWAQPLFPPKDRIRCEMDSLSFYSRDGRMSAYRDTLQTRCKVETRSVLEVLREDIGTWYRRNEKGVLHRLRLHKDPKKNKDLFEARRLKQIGPLAAMVRVVLRRLSGSKDGVVRIADDEFAALLRKSLRTIVYSKWRLPEAGFFVETKPDRGRGYTTAYAHSRFPRKAVEANPVNLKEIDDIHEANLMAAVKTAKPAQPAKPAEPDKPAPTAEPPRVSLARLQEYYEGLVQVPYYDVEDYYKLPGLPRPLHNFLQLHSSAAAPVRNHMPLLKRLPRAWRDDALDELLACYDDEAGVWRSMELQRCAAKWEQRLTVEQAKPD